jgi:hypothetical protein
MKEEKQETFNARHAKAWKNTTNSEAKKKGE